eukprot:TRINITY_DN5208_c0_g1_i2.p1 TRINITY_DN5208_c0_g1~~TRINITY_DN5208_c0_g1_i2.p1  ORF type:complete len:324 (-),score=96.03 TRINITY_DN5208_c0_g1_i2:196-1167(-)
MSPAAATDAEMPQLKLNNGALMPACGLGTWNSPKGEVYAAVKAALECGYRHIDCAWIYGNEDEVGQAFKETTVDRKDYFVTGKLWNSFHHAADAEAHCKDTLQKLGLDYLDLYLMHWPVCLKKGAPLPPGPDDFEDIPLEETWKAMEALVEKGLVKAIGVSNFSIKKMQTILNMATVKPAVNQVEGHPYLQQPQLKEFCDAQGIVITAYSPLGSPERPARVKDLSDPVLMEDPTLVEIAKKEDRTPAEVLIRWAVQRGTVVIPKSVTPARIQSNLAAASRPLSDEAMDSLTKMDRHLRLLKGFLWLPEGTTGPMKSLTDLWDE